MSALDNDSSPGRPSASRAGPERSNRRRVCDSNFDYVGRDSTHTKRSTVTKRPISMRGCLRRFSLPTRCLPHGTGIPRHRDSAAPFRIRSLVADDWHQGLGEPLVLLARVGVWASELVLRVLARGLDEVQVLSERHHGPIAEPVTTPQLPRVAHEPDGQHREKEQGAVSSAFVVRGGRTRTCNPRFWRLRQFGSTVRLNSRVRQFARQSEEDPAEDTPRSCRAPSAAVRLERATASRRAW